MWGRWHISISNKVICIRKDAFKRANEAFSKVSKNYSKMIKSKQIPAIVIEAKTPLKIPQFRDKDRETSCAKKNKEKVEYKANFKERRCKETTSTRQRFRT